ncbi:MAG: magnesium/cobalt transporter CorA [Candidatus Kapabacteria bacterium]|nr:magnesium/cobalt transporter CorA [Candidatus Kapabacteria bacterium]
MKKNKSLKSLKTGLSPGSVIFVGERKLEFPEIKFIEYDENNFSENKLQDFDDQLNLTHRTSPCWLVVTGIHDTSLLTSICSKIGISTLITEDIADTKRRSKVEFYDDYIFITIKSFVGFNGNDEINFEQHSLILGKNLLISFSESRPDYFKPIIDRIRVPKSRLSTSDADYLCYALIDFIIDNYFSALEKLDDKMDDIEENMLANKNQSSLTEIKKLKRNLIIFHRMLWPVRELVHNLDIGETSLINKSSIPFIRDLYDHSIEALEATETLRDMAATVIDVYLSTSSFKMNEIMKVLTIISTIFMPLTFIAGVYGMNFEVMPELKWHFGYFAVLILMSLISIAMLFYFKKKRWL